MPPTGATRPRLAPPPPPPSGVLFFVHGANETSEGLARNVARIEDQVSRRGWDVRVVAPEWRRRSGLRLGNWRKALYRGARPAAISISNVPRGVGRAAVLKLVTNYFEGRREMLLDTVGAQMLADVIGYHEHRDSIQDVLQGELAKTAKAARGRTVLPVGLSPRWHRARRSRRLVARRPGRGVRHRRVAGAAALYVRCDPIIAVRRGRSAAPPRSVAERIRQPGLPVLRRRASVPTDGWPRDRGRPSRPLGPGFPAVTFGVLGAAGGLGRHRDGLHLAPDRSDDGP